MKKQNWEKEFDKYALESGIFGHQDDIDYIKSFISKTLAKEKQNWLEELESRQIKE